MDVQQFVFEGNEVKIRFENGEPYWKAKDVCELLGLSWQGDKSISFVPNHLKVVYLEYTSFGDKPTYYLNEPGLYFYLSKVRSPKALPFQLWIAEKVIPSIRKTGSYSLQPKVPITFAEALRLAADQAEMLEKQATKLIVQQPKVLAFEQLMQADGLFDWIKVAKVLGMGRNNLTKLLRDKKVLMRGARQNVPYQNFVDDGYFVVKTIVIPLGDKLPSAKVQTFTTPKGLEYIRKLVRDIG